LRPYHRIRMKTNLYVRFYDFKMLSFFCYKVFTNTSRVAQNIVINPLGYRNRAKKGKTSQVNLRGLRSTQFFFCCYFIRLGSVWSNRKTVLSKKMFIPAIKNPIAAISPKFSDLKSLTLNTKRRMPMMLAVQANHFSVFAASNMFFMTHDPCRHIFVCLLITL
jgi:hypothetical protein